jgi:hypothetical protein
VYGCFITNPANELDLSDFLSVERTDSWAQLWELPGCVFPVSLVFFIAKIALVMPTTANAAVTKRMAIGKRDGLRLLGGFEQDDYNGRVQTKQSDSRVQIGV